MMKSWSSRLVCAASALLLGAVAAYPQGVEPPASSTSSGITVGTSAIAGGTDTRVLYDNAGKLGEYTNTQLTALINAATVALSGALPAFPNNTTTFFRGDGTYAGVGTAALTGLGTGVATALGVNVGSAGAFVTLNGALGTPSSGTLTNATGLPISTGVSGLGTGVATLLGGNASGTGGPAGTTSPTFTTPALGAATGTSITLTGSVHAGSGSVFDWTSRSAIDTPSDGVIRITNNAQTDFSRLQFGGTTSSFPALKRSAAILAVRLADDSADAQLNASNVSASGGVFVAGGAGVSIGANGGSLGQLQIKGSTSGTLTITTDATAANLLIGSLAQTSAAQSGTVCYNSGTAVVTYDATLGCLASSMRFKHDWKPLVGALDRVARMEAGSFWYNDQQAVPGEQIGLNAENVAEIDPRLVGYDDQGRPRAVRYLNIVAVLVQAVKELKADNDNLRARIGGN